MVIRRRPGMNDVAKLAGVSHQTVSRVLNDHPNVAEVTRARVEAAIAELGYRRNTAARSLVTNETKTIGVLLFESSLFGPSNTFLGLQEAARAAGYFVTVAANLGIDRNSLASAVDYFLDQNVEAIALIPPTMELIEHVQDLVKDMPLIIFTSADLDSTDTTHIIKVDHYTGARMAVRHLIEQGCKRIGHIKGPEQWVDSGQRHLGFMDELEAHGLEPGPVVAADSWTPESGYAAARKMLEAGSSAASNAGGGAGKIDGLFAANDLLALGALRVLDETGHTVPGDVAIVGYDDIQGAAYLRPSLTTINVNYVALGQLAVTQVVSVFSRGLKKARGRNASAGTGSTDEGLPGNLPANAATQTRQQPAAVAPQLLVRDSTLR